MRLVSLILGILLFASSCVQRLSVYTDYIGRETLASFQVGTPDPLLLNPPTGQRLIVKWHLPHSYMNLEDLRLTINLRLRNRSTQNLSIPICHTTGTYLYPVLGDTYSETRGILTYHVEIVGGGEVLEEWIHPLWTPIIELNNAPK